MINTHDGGGLMEPQMNNKMMIEVVSKDNNYLISFDNFNTVQNDWLMINSVRLLISEDKFNGIDSMKIFQNILIDGCEFIKEINYNKEDFTRVMIDTSEITYSRCLEIIEMIQLMIDRANNIGDIITNGIVKEKVNQGFLTKYKMLIEGIKPAYEKGLILVKMLFKDDKGDGLLSKYYRVIQKKESFDKRKEIFYDLLLNGNGPLVVNGIKCKKRNYKKK